jgi:hypothetical protein
MAQIVKPTRRLRIRFIFVPRFFHKPRFQRRRRSFTNCPWDNHTDCLKASDDFFALLSACFARHLSVVFPR